MEKGGFNMEIVDLVPDSLKENVIVTSVDDFYIAIINLGVVGCSLVEVFFVFKIDASNLVPFS